MHPQEAKPCSCTENYLWLGWGGEPTEARFTQPPHEMGWGEGGLECVVSPLVRGTELNPPLHKLAQPWDPQPHRPHPWAMQVRGREGGVKIHQRPPKALPRLIPGVLHHRTAPDAQRCNRSRVCCESLVPALGHVLGHSHLA